MPDLLVNLLKLPPLEPLLDELKKGGVNIRRAQPFEITPVSVFIEERFSIAWADEADPKNKDCTSYCQYTVGLSAYSGGRFMWTIGILRVDKNRKVTGTVCPSPPPYFFDY